jgi:hypothetical protein
MLTPERIFVVQINDKVNGSTTNVLSGVNIADQINVDIYSNFQSSTGVLCRPDQLGNVDIYSNFQSSIQEDQKYLVNHDADASLTVSFK